jgi:hypothetical protein
MVTSTTYSATYLIQNTVGAILNHLNEPLLASKVGRGDQIGEAELAKTGL